MNVFIFSPDISKCLKEKLATSELQKKNVNLIWFVPSCNADGTYTSVQCEKQSKYCWCVDPITGRNIPNSSVRNAKPDCSKHCKSLNEFFRSSLAFSTFPVCLLLTFCRIY